MTLEFKASVKHYGEQVIPIVDEYRHGVFKRSLEFADAPVFKDMLNAYIYAREQADELNRRVKYEKR